ncbi:MAG TPA: hypothetical protein PLM05_09745, partial [Bacteroidales bacterium]|nr:hypothetical protein [Bacteroidales bacterium]HOR10277.1 hypothetical protein [Bacteroidales bacterium]
TLVSSTNLLHRLASHTALSITNAPSVNIAGKNCKRINNFIPKPLTNEENRNHQPPVHDYGCRLPALFL